MTPKIYPEGIRVHTLEQCVGQYCPFHRPSKHKMVEWPMNVRLDRWDFLTERLCPHGIGHPDPDSISYIERNMDHSEVGYTGVHGCDGCCQEPLELHYARCANRQTPVKKVPCICDEIDNEPDAR